MVIFFGLTLSWYVGLITSTMALKQEAAQCKSTIGPFPIHNKITILN